MKRIVFLLSVLLVLPVYLGAQLKSPAEFMPETYGKAFTPHHRLIEYFNYVLTNSSMVAIREIGMTTEHRPMVLAFVSSPENITRLEQIRLNNLRLAGIEPGTPDLQHPIAIVWLEYSVHGNEAAGSEASMQVLYNLVTGKNGAANWLENTVVIMEPSVNPDGYSRYSSWNNQVSALLFNASPDAIEHDEPWPGGRTNHYLFDLNRDWVWQTQVESRQRLMAFRQWMPHVVADLHEMEYTNPYYFPPAPQPYQDYITTWQSDFQKTIGENHARHFDESGWAYYTREDFDLFYPSYADTYSMFSGAIGMTYEQGGSSYAGRAIVLANGDTLTLADRIAHHTAASLSTVEVTSQNANKVVSEFAKYFKQSHENPPGPYKAYLIKALNGQGKLRELCRLLDNQGIEYGTANQGSRAQPAFHYTSGREELASITSDDLVVSAYQPRAVLTQILFDPESRLADSATYDITCWSLPFAYGLDAYALREKVEIKPGYRFIDKQQPVSPDAYAYAVRWQSLDDGIFLAAALKQGLHPRFSLNAFTAGGKHFNPGTILFMRSDHRQVPDFVNTLIRLGKSLHTNLESIASGFTDTGKDFGSPSYRLIPDMHVLTFSGDGVSATDFGQIWYFFEQVLHFPVTVVNIGSLGSVQWDKYQVLIMPEGYYSIPESTMKSIADWTNGGGKVIAIGSALSQFADKDGFALKHFAESSEADDEKKAEEQGRLERRLETYAARTRSDITERIPGTVFRAKVDQSHPLGFGLGKTYFTLRADARPYEHLVNASNVVYLDEDLTHYGFAGAKALGKQKNSIVFSVENKGGGSIVYLADNPLFRGFWENGMLAFCNSLFFVGN